MEQQDNFKVSHELTERLILLQDLHDKKLLYRQKVLRNPHTRPLNIEILGTPGSGKSECINALYEFFRRGGFSVYLANSILENNLSSFVSASDELIQLAMAEKMSMLYLQISNCTAYDIILYDTGILDRYLWQLALCNEGKFSKKFLEEYEQSISREMLDYTAGLFCSPQESQKRTLSHTLALEPKYGYSLPDLYSYNAALGSSTSFLERHSGSYQSYATERRSLDDINIALASEIVEMGLKR